MDDHFLDVIRAPFVAKLTASTLTSGTYYYDWTEQAFNVSTGAYQDATPPRSGTGSTSPMIAPALEANNANVTTPVYVWLKLRGMVGGTPYYEFVAPGTSTGGGGPSVVGTSPISVVTSGGTATVSLPKANSNNRVLATLATATNAQWSDTAAVIAGSVGLGATGHLCVTVETAGGSTVTLPAGSTVGINYMCWVVAVGACTVSVAGSTSDTITGPGVSGGTSISLAAGQMAGFVATGLGFPLVYTWYVFTYH